MISSMVCLLFLKVLYLELQNMLNVAMKGYLCTCQDICLGPVVQSIVSLTTSLRVISLTVLVDSIYNILIFFAEKM